MHTNTKKISFAFVTLLFLGAACTPGSVGRNNDGGIFFTKDIGQTWEQRNTIYADNAGSKSISNLSIKRMLFSPSDDRKIFAIATNDGLWISWNEGNNWDPILSNSSVYDIAIDPTDSNTIYAAVGGSIAKTEDEGISWKGIYSSDLTSTKITSIVIDPKNNNRILFATNESKIIISDDGGVAWRVYTETPGVLIKLLYHPTRNSTIYAGSDTKGLVRSRDNGATWEDFTDAFSQFDGATDYRDFVLIPSGVVYASRFGLLRSLNHGSQWATLPLISGKKDSNIQSLAVDTKNPLHIYYGTHSTFYVSLDGGLNWIPRVIPSSRTATAIAINPSDSSLIYLGLSR